MFDRSPPTICGALNLQDEKLFDINDMEIIFEDQIDVSSTLEAVELVTIEISASSLQDKDGNGIQRNGIGRKQRCSN